jgi:hypothetical protein
LGKRNNKKGLRYAGNNKMARQDASLSTIISNEVDLSELNGLISSIRQD